MSFPIECKRIKKYVVNEDFINAIKKAFSGSKAEKLPESSHYPLYVGEDLMEQMKTNDNQIIWGRRGTGKTHLLKAFNQCINDDPDISALSYYISCDTIKFESPISIEFKDDFQKMRYCARETFKLFMNDLVEQIIDTYEIILNKKYVYGDKTNDEQEIIKKEIDKYLTELMDNITEGVPKVIESNSSKHNEVKNKIQRTISVNLSNKFTHKKISPELGFDIKNNKGNESQSEFNTIQKMKYEFSFQKFHKSFSKLMKSLCVDRLYICIDELWLIDQKSMITYQPLFLDYLKQTVFSIPQISIKIASIRETTKLNSKNNMINNFGLQSGHDIIEMANLDSMQYSNEELIRKFTNILWTRINYFSNECQISNKDSIYTREYILKTIFKNTRYFEILISLAHGIPRNVLYTLRMALNGIGYNLSEYFLHVYNISDVVINIYKNEKRASLPMNENSIYTIISNYVDKHNAIFFLLSTEHVKQYNVEINNLIYVEIIHRIPSSLTPSNIMDKYKAYYIDTGKFLSILKEKNLEKYKEIINDFELCIPKDIVSEYNNYVINLDTAPNNFVECPNCGAAFSKNHPVYLRYKCCITCSFEFNS